MHNIDFLPLTQSNSQISYPIRRSFGYNPSFCLAISAELRCFEIWQDTRWSAKHARESWMLQSYVFCPAELWFVELSVSHMHAPMCASMTHYLVSTTVLWFRENIELLTWLNRLQLSLYEHSRVGLEVSTILKDVMGSRSSKSIEQRCSASGYRLGWRSRVLHQPDIQSK